MPEKPYQGITALQYERLTPHERYEHHTRLRGEMDRRLKAARLIIGKTRAFLAKTK